MATRERAVDRGGQRGSELDRVVGSEIRLARRGSGLSLERVADEAGISASELSRIERGRAPWVSLLLLARLCAIVGLELSARAYPGGAPLRDARHAELLERFRRQLHPSLRWRTEVPLPIPGDRRAWDGTVTGSGWFYGVEAELNPLDGQAIVRRLQLKRRDGSADGTILLLPDTRTARAFRRTFADLIRADFPRSGRRAMGLLRAGADPGASAVVSASDLR